MNLLSKRVFCTVTFTLLTMFAAGCQAPSKRIYTITDGELYARVWIDIVRENPISKDENIKVTPLFKDKNSSHHIVQINDREESHIHANHDLTVIVKRGKGTLHLRDKALPMSAGDVAFISRGTVHWFVNDKKGSPSIAYLIFYPAFDGKDRRPFSIPQL
ncbi:MAG: cupin domain-containing protein [Proteobacteria bacterium]|nr:cupin domain-containing protein [Pseudomonadota bacterium]